MEHIDTEVKGESLGDHIKGFAETYVKLTVAKTTQKSADFAATGITGMLCVFFCLLVLFFVGIGLAMWIGEAMGNVKAGYFIVAGIYTVLALVIYVFRKQALYPFIQNLIVKKAYD